MTEILLFMAIVFIDAIPGKSEARGNSYEGL